MAHLFFCTRLCLKKIEIEEEMLLQDEDEKVYQHL